MVLIQSVIKIDNPDIPREINNLAAEFSADDICYLANARFKRGGFDHAKGRIETDTRRLSPGSWFLALAGENEDGHDFIEDAMYKGALGCIVEERTRYPFAGPSAKLLSVANTDQAYLALARAWRHWTSPLVIAVAEDSPLNPITRACAAVFSGLRTYQANAAANDMRASMKAVLQLPRHAQLLLLGRSDARRGELSRLASTTSPDIAIVASGDGQSQSEINSKCELLESLDEKKGLAILSSSDEPLIKRALSVCAARVQTFAAPAIAKTAITPNSTQFQLNDSEIIFALPLESRVSPEAAWCAITCGREYGLSDQAMAASLNQLNATPVSEPVSRRRVKSDAVSSGASI